LPFDSEIIFFKTGMPPSSSPLRGPVSKDSPPRDDFCQLSVFICVHLWANRLQPKCARTQFFAKESARNEVTNSIAATFPRIPGYAAPC
jgi:hypothetical protein